MFMMVALASLLKQRLFIAPPLMVTFVELSGDFQKFKLVSKKVMLMVTFCAVVSSLSRYFFCIVLGWPLISACAIATISLLYLIEKTKVYFPPVGALLSCLY